MTPDHRKDTMNKIDYLLRLDRAQAAGMDLDPGDYLNDTEILGKVKALLGPGWHGPLTKHMDDLQEAAFVAALESGLPVFEEGGIVALAQADLALTAARRA